MPATPPEKAPGLAVPAAFVAMTTPVLPPISSPDFVFSRATRQLPPGFFQDNAYPIHDHSGVIGGPRPSRQNLALINLIYHDLVSVVSRWQARPQVATTSASVFT